ncbi:hypothetical protein MRX96_011849 [Rhipicephalus microplus]
MVGAISHNVYPPHNVGRRKVGAATLLNLVIGDLPSTAFVDAVQYDSSGWFVAVVTISGADGESGGVTRPLGRKQATILYKICGGGQDLRFVLT